MALMKRELGVGKHTGIIAWSHVCTSEGRRGFEAQGRSPTQSRGSLEELD